MQLPAQLRKRSPETHKGDYGYLFILGGSTGLTGAVCLAAEAALRIGAGLVKVGVPKSLNSIFEIKLTEAMSLPLPDKGGYLLKEAFGELKKILDRIDVILIGPGASRNRGTQQLLLKVAQEIDKPMVVDADAVNALSSKPGVLDNRRTKSLVLTPHPGEFSRLIRLEKGKISKNRKNIAKQFAAKLMGVRVEFDIETSQFGRSEFVIKGLKEGLVNRHGVKVGIK